MPKAFERSGTDSAGRPGSTSKIPPRVSRPPLMLTALTPFVALAAGCMPELRRPLSVDEMHGIRGQAIQVLKQAATSEDPVLRMQAIEAFQEVAPEEGLPYIVDSIDNGYAGISFASLMAIGTLHEKRYIEKVRVRAEDSDAHVRIGALYALHRMGDQKRTSELGELLLTNADPRVRANAALAIGRLGEKGSIKLLRTASQKEKKDFVKIQIREALAMLHDERATDELVFAAHSAAAAQAIPALMCLAASKNDRAEEVFRHRLHHADQPEIRLEAARGLGLLGNNQGYDIAVRHLFFCSPDRNRKDDPPQQQIARVRSLAALALEAIGDPDALGPLKEALEREGQVESVRLSIARAVLGIMNRTRATAR